MKWQYWFVHTTNPADLSQKLNQAGAAGWEAVSMVVRENHDPDHFAVLLKKPA